MATSQRRTRSTRTDPASFTGVTMRDAARAIGFDLGAAVAVEPLRDNPAYAEALAQHFSMVVPENATKFGPLSPRPREHDFTDADLIIDFARARGMKVRGHTLVWHAMQPRWLTEGGLSDAQVKDILRSHIHTVVGRYRGLILSWDVVNEAVGDDAALRNTFWLERLGPAYLEWVFHWAREADPDVQLVYNDYGAEDLNAKSDAIFELVRGLRARGVPVDAVGLQMHVPLEHPRIEEFEANLRRLHELGVATLVTEMDVRLRAPVSDDALRAQAEVYRRVLEACLRQRGGGGLPGCQALLTWGVTDDWSWVPGFFKGFDAGLLLDHQLQPKPAYRAIVETLVASGARHA